MNNILLILLILLTILLVASSIINDFVMKRNKILEEAITKIVTYIKTKDLQEDLERATNIKFINKGEK